MQYDEVIRVRLPKSAREALKIESERLKVSQSKVIREALETRLQLTAQGREVVR